MLDPLLQVSFIEFHFEVNKLHK